MNSDEHFCEELVAICLTDIWIVHELDIAVNTGQIVTDIVRNDRGEQLRRV